MCIIVIDFITDELKIFEDNWKDLLQNLVDKKCLLKINKYKGVILKWLLKKENPQKKK